MRKIFNNVLVGATSVAMVASLAVGIGGTDVKADALQLTKWSFTQGGMYNKSEPGNEGYINSVKVNDEVISGWERNVEAKQTQTASAASDGFAIDIENTGWDAVWDVTPNQINPWAVQAEMDSEIEAGHSYTVTFKAHASKKKFAYVAFGTETENLAPYDKAPVTFGGDADNQVITLGTTDKTYSFTFTNWVSAKTLKTTFMLGAFDAKYDYAGNDISSIIKDVENTWKGTVTVSEFSITDNGKDANFEDKEPEPENPNKPNNSGNNNSGNTTNNNNKSNQTTTPAATTVAPAATTAAPATVSAPAQVKSVKAKNSAKKTAKITWKKVKGAKSYQVKVGNKKYNAKKVSYTVKKLTVGKTYKVQVRAKNAAGFGKWSKAVKVTIKK